MAHIVLGLHVNAALLLNTVTEPVVPLQLTLFTIASGSKMRTNSQQAAGCQDWQASHFL